MLENSLVKLVSKFSLWLAPLPSAYFVSRASVEHLAVVRPFDIVIALVIELLGISTMHTLLWLYGWRQESLTATGRLRTGYTGVTSLEIGLSVFFGLVYLLTTISIIVVLEVLPGAATFALALFPLLSVVGAANLALIARQESRERILAEHKVSKKKPKEKPKTKPGEIKTSSNGRQAKKEAKKAVLVALYQNNPLLGTLDASQQLGVSDQTIRNYLGELEDDSIIERNGKRIIITSPDPATD